MPKSFFENANLIAAGDFSFVFNEENKELLEQYKYAQWLLGSELATECIENPKYMEVLSRELCGFSEGIVRAQKVINNLPYGRSGKKVINYINACSSMSTGKTDLQDKNRYPNETLEEYIKANAKELLNEHSPMSRFVKICTYDVNGLANSFFEELRKNERTFEIIKQRSTGQTLEQVGAEYAVTRERVRQIEKKASQRFVNWVKHNSIILKIVADEGGNCVLLPSVFDVHLSKHAEVFRYLLKINEEDFSNVFYDKALDLFVVGNESLILKAQEYVEEMPEKFNDEQFNKLLEIGLIERELPKELVRRTVEENYKKTGDIYHCSRLTLGKIYADVLEKHYQKGIWVYNDAELEEFRKYVREDFGDIKLSDNNRALVGRIAAVGILCGRGIYGPKKRNIYQMNYQIEYINIFVRVKVQSF